MQDLNDYFQEIVFLVNDEINKDIQKDSEMNLNLEFVKNNYVLKNELRNKIEQIVYDINNKFQQLVQNHPT